VRVPDEAALGNAKVTISYEEWPEGQALPSTYLIPVVARKPLPTITVSPDQRRIWSADSYEVENIGFSPNGRHMIVQLSKRMKDGHLYQFWLWDAESGKARCKLFQIDPEPRKTIYTPYISFSKDNDLLALHYNLIRYVGEGKEVRSLNNFDLRVFDLEAGRECWGEELADLNTGGAAFSSDCKTLYVGAYHCKEIVTEKGRRYDDFKGDVRCFAARSGDKQPSLPVGACELVLSVQTSPNGQWLLVQDEHRGNSKSEPHLIVCNLAEGKRQLDVTASALAQGTFSPLGNQIVTSTNTWVQDEKKYNRDIKIWNLENSKVTTSLPLPAGKGWILQPNWSPDGKYIYLTSNRAELWRWDPAASDPVEKVESFVDDPTGKSSERYAWAQHLSFSAGLCAFGINGKLPQRITKRNLADDYAELPPPEIVLWDLQSMSKRATLTGHFGQINCVAFSPDGKTFVSGGSDGTVRFWNVASRKAER
jgi:WD40 repeat protein